MAHRGLKSGIAVAGPWLCVLGAISLGKVVVEPGEGALGTPWP